MQPQEALHSIPNTLDETATEKAVTLSPSKIRGLKEFFCRTKT